MTRWTVVVALAGGLAAQSGPLVQGRDVTFVAAGDASDPPRIVADFNGWEGGGMTPSGDSRTYTLRVTLDPAARIEYLIAYRERFALDSGNPRTVPAPAGPPRSELLMPDYRPPPPLAPARRRGTIEEMPFASRKGEQRRIRVYVPPTGARGVPILYVHDGDIVLGALGLPATLDALIEREAMPPVAVAFLDAVDRHDDYEPGSAFLSVFVNEIVPHIERRYGVANDRRAVMGLSRSAVGALDACANGGVHFDACVLVAPAVAPRYFQPVLPPKGGTTRFLIAAGTYDLPLIADARALRDELTRRELPVRYAELPQGHNHTAFRAALPALLQALFPQQAPEKIE